MLFRSSSPALSVPNEEAGQEARYELTIAMVLKLASSLGVDIPDAENRIEKLLNSKYFLVRNTAAGAFIAYSIGTVESKRFIEALLAYEKGFAEAAVFKQLDQDVLSPDQDYNDTLVLKPERWDGLIFAAVFCLETDVDSTLSEWLQSSEDLIGKESATSKNIAALIEAVSLPNTELDKTIRNTDVSPFLRCGATVKRLRNEHEITS